jgi:glutathionyl-hydroquinone reductase
VLWDKQLKTVVNNESSEIIRMLNAEFNGIARNPGLDEFLFLFLLCMFI